MNIILFRRKVGTLLWQCKLRLLYVAAYVWRHLLLRTTFIAITDSVGKTTTPDSKKNHNDRMEVHDEPQLGARD